MWTDVKIYIIYAGKVTYDTDSEEYIVLAQNKEEAIELVKVTRKEKGKAQQDDDYDGCQLLKKGKVQQIR